MKKKLLNNALSHLTITRDGRVSYINPKAVEQEGNRCKMMAKVKAFDNGDRLFARCRRLYTPDEGRLIRRTRGYREAVKIAAFRPH